MVLKHLPIRRRTAFLMAVCLGLVALADWLFYHRPIGWTASLYALALLVAVTLRDGRYLRHWPGRIVGLGTLSLAAALLLEPSPLAVVLGLIGLVTIAILDRSGWTWGAASWAFRWAQFVIRACLQPLRDVLLCRRWQRVHGADATTMWVLGRWLGPVLLSLVFAGMFVLANPIISRWLDQARQTLWTWISTLSEQVGPTRVGLWLVVAIGAWALLRVRADHVLRAIKLKDRPRQRVERITRTDLVVRCLLLFNLAFSVQTGLDVRYLWGDAPLPANLTYAEYAHRGAYPLVATALLAGAFVLVTFRHGGAAEASASARRLVYLWIGQNVLLLAAAVWRVGLYVEAYSLTRWRVAAMIWMGLVAVGLAWTVWRIVRKRSNGWLLGVNAVMVLAVWYGCCFVDFDGRIAWFNVRHCREIRGPDLGHPIDLNYLEQLGPESLPALVWLAGELGTEHKTGLAARFSAGRLRSDLHGRLSDWRGWTYRRQLLAVGQRSN